MASLTSQNIFAISIYIKHVKDCDHKAFQGFTAVVFLIFIYLVFLTCDKSQVLNVQQCFHIYECEEWLADLGRLFWTAGSIL